MTPFEPHQTRASRPSGLIVDQVVHGYVCPAIEALLRPHRHDCDCAPCVELRTNLAAIAEAERRAWEASRDIFIR